MTAPSHRPHRLVRNLSQGLALVSLVGLGSLAACDGESEPSMAEKLAAGPKEEVVEVSDKPKKEALPDELPPPSDAEFAAWNRKDPEGEKHLYKWDKRNLPRMWGYWMEMSCFRDKVKEEGAKAFGADPTSPEGEKWYQFKRVFIPFLDLWQQRFFANEPRILEKSKFVGHFLEAHELLMNGYPKAYNEGDETELRKQDAHWLLVNDRVKRYVDQLGLGKKYKLPDLENPKEKKKYDKMCEKALKPKKGKGPKKVKEKSPI